MSGPPTLRFTPSCSSHSSSVGWRNNGEDDGKTAAEPRRNSGGINGGTDGGTAAEHRHSHGETTTEQRRSSGGTVIRCARGEAAEWDFGLAGWGGRRNSVGTVAEQLRNSCGTTAEQLRNNGGTAVHCTQGEVVG